MLLAQVLRCFEQRPASVFGPAGAVTVADAAQLVSVGAADFVKRPVAEGDHAIKVDADVAFGACSRADFAYPGPMSSETTSPRERDFPSSVKNRSAAAFVALGAPHDLPADVVSRLRGGRPQRSGHLEA